MNVLIFTPTWIEPGTGQAAMRPECQRSIEAQQIAGGFDWLIGAENPYPIGDLRNVLHQYQWARHKFLTGEWTALITVEHDHELPDPGALQRMMDTPGDVIYAPYWLRHDANELNLYSWIGSDALGRSLSQFSEELEHARAAVVWPVSGAGFGCTLFRRNIVELIPFEASDASNPCPDLGFARAALKAGFRSMGRLDVPVAHRWLGSWWSPWGERLGAPDRSDLIDEQWQRDWWLNHEQWRCVLCQWDTLRGLAVARAHAQGCPRCHPPKEEKAPSPVLVADKWGVVRNA